MLGQLHEYGYPGASVGGRQGLRMHYKSLWRPHLGILLHFPVCLLTLDSFETLQKRRPDQRCVGFVAVRFEERGLLFQLLPDPLRSALRHCGALAPVRLNWLLTIQDLQISASEADEAARSSSFSEI